MIEALESRQFFSATPLAVPTAGTTVVPAVQVNGGSQQNLVVVVGSGDTQPRPNVVIAIIAILIGL